MSDENPIGELVPHLGDAPIAPFIGIGAIALQMAMKYHDIGTVQEGALYDALKRDGKQMVPLNLLMVFETAKQIEEHLVQSNERISAIVTGCLEQVIGVEAVDNILDHIDLYCNTLEDLRNKVPEVVKEIEELFIEVQTSDGDLRGTALKALVAYLVKRGVSEEAAQKMYSQDENPIEVADQILSASAPSESDYKSAVHMADDWEMQKAGAAIDLFVERLKTDSPGAIEWFKAEWLSRDTRLIPDAAAFEVLIKIVNENNGFKREELVAAIDKRSVEIAELLRDIIANS